MRITREWLWVPLALMTATALLLLPFWLRGGSQGHDLFHHLLSGHFFAVQLWQGEIYPRWLMEMNGAFGSPAFFFYPPLPYYVSALFAGPEPLAHHAMIPLLWSNTLALGLSGLFAYLWLRPFATSGRALAASLLYMALPYHLAIDIYARFALAESWAFVWAPLALLAQDRLCRRAPFALLLLALAVAWLTLLTLVLLLVAWAAAREPRHPELLIWGVIGTLSFLMMLPLSEPLWHLLPPLQLVQFPWRLNLLLVIATVAVVALGVPAYRPWQWLWWTVLALTLLSQAVYVHESPLTQAPQKSALNGEFDSKRSAREYRPKQVPKGMFAPTLLAWKDEFQPAITTEQQGISWQILNWQPRQIVLTVDAPTPAKLILHQFDYPGWQAKLDDTLPLTISSTRNGLIQVWVPAGRHQVTFTLTARWPERLGYGLSLIAWLIWSLLLASQIRTLRRQHQG